MTTRPKRFSEETNRRIVEAIYPEVALWLKTSGETEDDEEGVKRDLMKAFKYNYEDDSYQIMKALDDDCHWMVDSGLQDAFERVALLRSKYHAEAVAAWVTANSIVPALEVGAPVQVTIDRKPVVGEVARVDAKQAQYVVYCQSLGHVRQGLGTHGTVLPFEEVAAYEPAAQQSEVRGDVGPGPDQPVP